MKSVIALMTLALVGCATQPMTQEVKETTPPVSITTTTVLVYDQECADVAEYAKSVAMFRDANIGLNEINYILNEPPDYPIDAMQRDVYYRIGENPLQTSIEIYKECVNNGYDALMQRYDKEQAKYRQGLEDAARMKIEQRMLHEAVEAEMLRLAR